MTCDSVLLLVIVAVEKADPENRKEIAYEGDVIIPVKT